MLKFYKDPIRIERSQSIIEKIKDYQEVEFHRSIAKRQRNVYNEQRNDVELLKNNVLVEFDFKEKIKTPIGPKEVNQILRFLEFFSESINFVAKVCVIQNVPANAKPAFHYFYI